MTRVKIIKHKIKYISLILLIIPLLNGCGAHPASKVVQPTFHQEQVLPEKITIENSIRGRAFVLTDVLINPENIDKVKNEIITNESLVKLLEYQFEETFLKANLHEGTKPKLSVIIEIEELKINDDNLNLMFGENDHLRTKILVRDIEENNDIFVSSIKCLTLSSYPVLLSPIGSLMVYGDKAREVKALSAMIPGMSVEVAKILSGFKEGQQLDQIKMLKYLYTTTDLMCGSFIKENDWGIDLLSDEELAKIGRIKIEEEN